MATSAAMRLLTSIETPNAARGLPAASASITIES
jgi:hypothetical protein